MYDDERLLIISNNVLSETTNNGKTLLSFFDNLPPKNVNQLYFSGELPTIENYNYFRISDMDIIRGRVKPANRGAVVYTNQDITEKEEWYKGKKHQYGNIKRLAREILWYKAWESDSLWSWLDQISPTTLFFLGGDACFAYEICKTIKLKYNSKLAMYITDDYVMPRRYETWTAKLRRMLIRKHLKENILMTDVFFTVSEIMARDYYAEFGKKSYTIVNMSDCLKQVNIIKRDDYVNLVYAGSLYYGRDDVLVSLSEAIKRFNIKGNGVKIKLYIYSNVSMNGKLIRKFSQFKDTIFEGALGFEELRQILNAMNIVVFVESFEEKNIEKVKYSLSTKIPEYMSLEKPILAIGPKEIGSIDYLEDVAFCINDKEYLYFGLEKLINNKSLQERLGKMAKEKYELNHRKIIVQEKFLGVLFGKIGCDKV